MTLKKALVGLALASAFVATDAQAETGWEGLEMRVALTAPVVDGHSKFVLKGSTEYVEVKKESDYKHNDDVWAGFSGTLSFGYRWGVFGLYVDQDMGGVWWTGKGDRDPVFIGGTYLTFRGLLGLRHDVELEFALGAGTIYSGGDKDKTDKIISNKDGEHSAAFALKFGFGLTYYLLPNTIGVGINLDYNLGLNIYSTEINLGVARIDGTQYNLIHHVNPGIHVIAQF
ncbi:MAG: hypothetical protein J6A01_05710 [Proteobacteria bacterium]|nr:hypothetical protein [Pseudomonadota bacterium]